MPRIGRYPPFGKRFFRRVRKIIGCCHFAHFWRVGVAIAAMNGRRNWKRIEQACRTLDAGDQYEAVQNSIVCDYY